MNERMIFLSIVLLSCVLRAQNPQATWMQYKTPEEAGWSSEKLAEAKQFYDQLTSAAFLLVFDGNVVIAWGEIERRFMCHSVRKSYLSALYGIHVEEGRIHLDRALSELGITERVPLTETEKQARVSDLLKARSGVYLPAAYETPAMKQARPPRGSHGPNTFWYYNNWDFNVLGTVFRQVTGKDIFEEFKTRIAEPLQMEDYRLIDGYYHLEKDTSIHPAYPFKMSARDMARFGLLYMRDGRWNNSQIVSERWIRESTTSYSDTRSGGYGYLWWIAGAEEMPGFYFAQGSGGHVIGVSASEKLVFVHRVNTYKRKNVPYAQVRELARKVLAARVTQPKPNPTLVELAGSSKQRAIVNLQPMETEKLLGDYPIDNRMISIRKDQQGLLLKSAERGTFRLLTLSTTRFLIEDLEDILVVELDQGGKPLKVQIQTTD